MNFHGYLLNTTQELILSPIGSSKLIDGVILYNTYKIFGRQGYIGYWEVLQSELNTREVAFDTIPANWALVKEYPLGTLGGR